MWRGKGGLGEEEWRGIGEKKRREMNKKRSEVGRGGFFINVGYL